MRISSFAISALLLLAGIPRTAFAHGHGHSHEHEHEQSHAHSHLHASSALSSLAPLQNFMKANPRLAAVLATIFVSSSSLVITPLLPLLAETPAHTAPHTAPAHPSHPNPAVRGTRLLKALTGFAVGGLLGDVFLHLLPHAFQAAAVNPMSDPVSQASHLGVPVLIGMLVFYVMEKGVGFVLGAAGTHSHTHASVGDQPAHHFYACERGRTHVVCCPRGPSSHDLEPPPPPPPEAMEAAATLDPVADSHGHVADSHGHTADPHGHDRGATPGIVEGHVALGYGGHYEGTCTEHSESPAGLRLRLQQLREQVFRDICLRCRLLKISAAAIAAGARPGAYLNLLADVLHNFADGLAIGVSMGKGHGLSTTLAVFFHEVPHNIADFAILIQNGFARMTALRAQFASSIGALLGCLAGLQIKDVPGMTGFLAGGFIYVATVDLIPLMLQDNGAGTTLLETLAMGLGVAMHLALLRAEHAVPGACTHI